LRSSLSLPRARHFDPSEPPPHAFSDSTWGFHLFPVGHQGTRLVVRAVARGRPKSLGRVADWLFWEPAHWVMQSRQFAGLHRRAENALLTPGA
jgi:proline iminopeptidase